MARTHPLEPGVCSWSLQPRSIEELIDRVDRVGVTGVHLAQEPLRADPGAWTGAGPKLAEHGIRVLSALFEPVGEDYATPRTIRVTGGIVPDRHWEANWTRLQDAARLAAALDVKDVTFHAGFLPEDEQAPAWAVIVDRVRRIADHFAETFGGTVLLETGQETAATLAAFLDALDRTNLGVNFDPANLLLYDMGDPVQALRELLPRIRQIHVKDARRPLEAGQWGEEVIVGTGEVDWPALLAALEEAAFEGPLIVEREAGTDRIADIRAAIDFLERIREERAG